MSRPDALPKIIVGAGVLQELFARHPEIELELVRNGADQIAEAFKRKINIDAQAERITAQVIARVNNELNSRYSIPKPVREAIDGHLKEAIKKFNKDQAETMAKEYFDEALKRVEGRLENRINEIATAAVERKMAAVFSTAARIGKKT